MLVVGIEDLFDNGKPQPGTFSVFSPGRICLVETVPDLWETALGYTAAGIFYGDKDGFVFYGSLHFNDGVRRAEFDGIVYEVV